MLKATGRNNNLSTNTSDKVNAVGSQQSLNGCGKGFLVKAYDSGFDLSHDTYNGISCASDGKIYYVLSSIDKDQGGRMFCFDPVSKKISPLGDLTEICGEHGMNTIPQGKSHVTFIESEGELFFSTHIGYYVVENDMDRMGTPPKGYKPYPGGHILSYNLKNKKFTDYGIPVKNEGILTMSMDIKRNLIYGITWPTGYFFRYNLNKKETKTFGPISCDGEKGHGDRFRVLCRSIAINSLDGTVYFSTSEGNIFRCTSHGSLIQLSCKEGLKKDYFGSYDSATPGHMAYNWRQIFWHDATDKFYGVHGNSGYLFSYDPKLCQVELLERLTSVLSKKSGMFDQFSYGYLGFTLGYDNETIYYLTGAPLYKNGKRVTGKANTGKGEAKGLEDLHLITYNLATTHYQDHGPLHFKDGSNPRYVNSIAIGRDGMIYFMGRIKPGDTTRTDLLAITDPFNNSGVSNQPSNGK